MRLRKYKLVGELVVAALVPCLLLAGCNWVAVKPSELPKLSGMTVGVVKTGPQAGQAVAVAVAKLERPDGRLLEVKGSPVIRITWNGTVYTFKPPLHVELRGDAFSIKSSNRAEMVFPINQIQKVEVRHGVSVAFWIVYGVVLAVGLALGIALPLILI